MYHQVHLLRNIIIEHMNLHLLSKSLWENNKFLDTNIHEGRGLIENNLLRYEEIPFNSVTVALKHYGNTNNRIKLQGETNGCRLIFQRII